MANHTLDCGFCGRDRRAYSRCCQEAQDKDRKRKELELSNKIDLYKYENLFGICDDSSKVKFFKFVYDNLDKLGDSYYLGRVKEIEATEKRESRCSHKYENGESSWEFLSGG